MSEQNPKDAKEISKEIDKLVAEAYAAIRLAEELAKQSGQTFSFDLAYGMGGMYDPNDGGWCPSSQSC